MNDLKALIFATTAALCMPAAVNATPQCVPLKPEVWDKACMADDRQFFSTLQSSDLEIDWLPSLEALAPHLEESSSQFSFDFDIGGDLRTSPLELDDLQDLSRESPAGDVDVMLEERS